jgi:RNA polymerase sigma factor (sigma-70 family)
VFVTTHWSVVRRAGRNDTPQARAALEQLCRAYWHPLFHYVRRCGHGFEDARDLTQGFFERLLERDVLGKADAGRGRFRSFLLAALKHYLGDEWDKARAQKRSGRWWSEAEVEDEERRMVEPLDAGATPERAYEQRWALLLLEQVYQRLAGEWQEAGKSTQFACLQVALAGERGAVPYADIARQTGLSEGAVKVAVHRLRRRYRTLLREAVAETVAEPAEVEEELRHLLRILSN